MKREDKLELCYDLILEDFGIEKEKIERFIRDLDIEDTVFGYFKEEINAAIEEKQQEYDYNQKHYNDGWNQHIGG